MTNSETTRSDELRSRVLRAVRENPAPTRAQIARRRAVMVAVAMVSPLVGLALAGGPHAGPRPASLLLATSGGTLVLACATIWMAIGRSGQMLDRARIWLALTALTAPPLWFVWKVILSAEFEGASDPWAGRPGARCFALTLALAICPLFLLATAWRGSDPTHPLSRGAALGVAAGTYAAVMVDLWCPIGDLRHVLLGHTLPVVVLGLVGVSVGHRLLAVRGRASRRKTRTLNDT
jgi:hypothetical protein